MTALAEDSLNLADRLQARDAGALAELHNQHGRMLYAVIYRIVKRSDIAEELTQEALLRAWNRASQLDSHRGNLVPWLVGIAKHCALDYQKAADNHRCVRVETSTIRAGESGLEDELLHAERARVISDALAQLPPHQRQVLEMAYYEDLPQAAIAERLQKPLGTVKGWTRAALLRMRIQLAEFQDPRTT
jgi:RNA polymerase sigma-70 factor (ECF subfamily)